MCPPEADEEMIAKKAENLAALLLGWAAESIPSFVSALSKEKISDEEMGEISKDIVVITIHFADRILCSNLGPKNPSIYMNKLFVAIEIQLENAHVSSVLDYYCKMAGHYSKYEKVFVGQTQNPKGSLIFEFAKMFVYAHEDGIDLDSPLALAMIERVSALERALFFIVNDALIHAEIVQEHKELSEFKQNLQKEPSTGWTNYLFRALMLVIIWFLLKIAFSDNHSSDSVNTNSYAPTQKPYESQLENLARRGK